VHAGHPEVASGIPGPTESNGYSFGAYARNVSNLTTHHDQASAISPRQSSRRRGPRPPPTPARSALCNRIAHVTGVFRWDAAGFEVNRGAMQRHHEAQYQYQPTSRHGDIRKTHRFSHQQNERPSYPVSYLLALPPGVPKIIAMFIAVPHTVMRGAVRTELRQTTRAERARVSERHAISKPKRAAPR